MGTVRRVGKVGRAVGQVVAGEVGNHPAVTEARRKWGAWRDPRARALRARKRSARATGGWSAVTVVAGGGAAIDFASVNPGLGAYVMAAFGALTLAAGVSSGVQTRRLYKAPLPPPAPPPRATPPASSRAREPVRRLTAAEQALAELLTELRTPRGRVPMVGGETVEATASAARESADALHGLATQLVAVERSKRAASPSDRASRAELDEAITSLRTRLDGGVDGYTKLVAAAARAVAAGATGPDGHAVTAATDELNGLADGLRELSIHYPG